MKNKDEQYRKALESLLHSDEYRPMRSRDMAHILGIPRSEFHAFRGVLEILRQQEQVVRGRDARWRLSADEKEVTGAIDIAMAGHGFVIPDNREDPDVFIPPDRMLDAFDGDRVRAKVTESERRGERRLSGRVVEVVARARTRIVGKMQANGRALIEDPRNSYEFAIELSPDAPAKSASQSAKSQRLRRNAEKAGAPPAKKSSVRLAAGGAAALPPAGQKVLLDVLSWPLDPRGPRAEIIEVLGPSGDPDTETAAILAENDAPGPFPEEVTHAARHLPRDLTPEEKACRLDATESICCTIDPADARDFDDALGIRRDGENFVVDVHIADVARSVPAGSVIDAEARERSTSIYLPERVIPMLPEEISNDLCSLRPGEVRPAKTVRLTFTPEGERVGYAIHRSFIRSRRRFTYEEVRDLITHETLRERFEDKDLLRCVVDLHALAMTLREKRLAAGSIELNLAEFRVVIDENGRATALEKVEHDFSHQLVEEFMLAANRAVAEWAASNGLPSLHRQHPPPKEERVEELAEFLNASGYAFKPPLQRRKLNAVIAKVAGRPEEHAINLMILKSFQQAVYGPEADVGHFAMNFPRYMHFTSPIRRYPDLFLHQMLDRAFALGAAKADRLPKKTRKVVGAGEAKENLEELGKHCSGRERRAMRIEEAVKDFRRLELLSKASDRDFDAVVTGVKKFGIFVEITGYFVEGMIPKAALAAKGFSTREELPPLASGGNRGRSAKARRPRMAGDPGFHIGQVVRVRVRKVDLAERQCELDFLGAE